MWKYMGHEIDPETLPTKDEMLAFINEEGMDDNALSKVRDQQEKTHGIDMVWRYPISEGTAAGGFILPVREGILWIPYDEMSKPEGELLTMQDAELLNAEGCRNLLVDMQSYTKELCDVLVEAATICNLLEQL